MEGRVTGCGWNGFFGRLSSCPYILSSSLLSPSGSSASRYTPVGNRTGGEVDGRE